jgi:hypothetical protein
MFSRKERKNKRWSIARCHTSSMARDMGAACNDKIMCDGS